MDSHRVGRIARSIVPTSRPSRLIERRRESAGQGGAERSGSFDHSVKTPPVCREAGGRRRGASPGVRKAPRQSVRHILRLACVEAPLGVLTVQSIVGVEQAEEIASTELAAWSPVRPLA